MTGWTAIIPVKPPGLAKSRLAVHSSLRERLARAFALDVVDAVSSTASIGQVIVVTADGTIAAYAQSRGVLAVSDRPLLSPDGLNAAIVLGRGRATHKWGASPLAVIPADLPAMTPEALEEALVRLGAVKRGFVPDAAGTGTTVSTAIDAGALRPLFGPMSAVRHAEDGALPVVEVDVRLRRDVDTVRDLAEARLLGVGRWTAATLAQERDPSAYQYQWRTVGDRVR